MIGVGYDDVMVLGDGDLMMVEKAAVRFLMVLDVFKCSLLQQRRR